MNKPFVKKWVLYDYMVEAGLDMSDPINKKLLEVIFEEVEGTVNKVLHNHSFAASVLGSSTSKKKAHASRENGKKGGRLRTNKPQQEGDNK